MLNRQVSIQFAVAPASGNSQTPLTGIPAPKIDTPAQTGERAVPGTTNEVQAGAEANDSTAQLTPMERKNGIWHESSLNAGSYRPIL